MERVHAVLALPVEDALEPPQLVEGLAQTGWRPGPWPEPGGNEVAEILNFEVPRPLQTALEGERVSFTQAPLRIAAGTDLVGIEFIPARSGAAGLLVLHVIINDGPTGLKTINSICRPWTEASCAVRQLVFERDPFGDPSSLARTARGLALVLRTGTDQAVSVDSKDAAFLVDTSEVPNPPLLLRTRLTQVLLAVTAQNVGLRKIVADWPTDLSDSAGFDRCATALHTFRHSYDWEVIQASPISQSIYRALRDELGIPATLAQLRRELSDNAQARRNAAAMSEIQGNQEQAQHNLRLSYFGLAFAALSLGASWTGVALSNGTNWVSISAGAAGAVISGLTYTWVHRRLRRS